MQYFHLHEVFVASDDLLHDADGDAFTDLLVLLDEGVESSMRTVFKYKIIMVVFFDDIVAFHDVRVIQLLVDLHLLFQQLQVLLTLTDLFLIHHFNRKLAPIIVN